MHMLHHIWLSAQCRKVRVALSEKGITFSMTVEPVWERRESFLAVNPAGEVPVLVQDGTPICGHTVITEFLEDSIAEPPLLPAAPGDRAEVRRLTDWFDRKFQEEVHDQLVGEKVMKRFLRLGQPDSAAIRAGLSNLHQHLEYITWLSDRRRWLGGDTFSIADIAAATQLSCVDYLGDVPWSDYPEAKNWYARVKSRPSFRPLLSDLIPGLPPPAHYTDLDF